MISVTSVVYIYGECIWKIVEENFYKISYDTRCTASKDGNCFQWDPLYYESIQKNEICRESCNLKECKQWSENSTIYQINECMTSLPCCAYSGPEPNAICIKRCCPRLYDKKKVSEKMCAQSVCNK